jgi:hypothetical protein
MSGTTYVIIVGFLRPISDLYFCARINSVPWITHFRNYPEEIISHFGAMQLRSPLLTLGRQYIPVIFELVHS